MRTSDFDYHLPQRLIAQTPAEPRDSSHLLVLHRDTGRMEHRIFQDLPDYLVEGDLLVLNDSRVIPARLYGHREDTGGKVELLLLHRLPGGAWRAMGKPGRALRPGVRVLIDGDGDPGLTVEILEASEEGLRTVRLSSEEAALQAGHTPLPSYIRRLPPDLQRYQTVYSRVDGSAAAPTAGLHFTHELLETLAAKGVHLTYVSLHVGVDTFRPVRADAPTEHKLHGEYFALGEAAAAELNAARRDGRRIVAVGTTSVRLLEQIAQDAEARGDHQILPLDGWASLYILPGHRFRLVNAMITNFHLPRTTLLMLVSAFAGSDPSAGSGRDLILRAYQEAIQLEYRFYSFGDCMLIF